MYTRCPGCHTVHPVNALLLAQELGKYRCGKCKQINNALESLFDEWPDPGDHPPKAGKLPVLGLKLDLEAAKQARLMPGEASSAAPLRNLDQLQLLSRDLRSHPTRSDALRLSLTIVNRAPRSQAFPKLEVILLDASGQALISRLFEPEEYLAQGADIDTGMTPEAYLHINLDLADPGRQAVGFELNFR